MAKGALVISTAILEYGRPDIIRLIKRFKDHGKVISSVRGTPNTKIIMDHPLFDVKGAVYTLDIQTYCNIWGNREYYVKNLKRLEKGGKWVNVDIDNAIGKSCIEPVALKSSI